MQDCPSFWGRILAACAVFAIGAFLIVEVYDLDIGWHIAIGRHILREGRIPSTDTFAAASFGRPYHDSHWLFQIASAAAHGAAGMVGVQFLMIALWAGIFWAVWRSMRHWGPAWVGPIVLFIAGMACTERFLPRPELVSYFMVAVMYSLLQRERYASWRDLGLWAILQTLWVNSHGLFVLGPVMAVAVFPSAFMAQAGMRRRKILLLLRLVAVLGIASFINPYGFGAWRYAALLFVEAGPRAPQMFSEVGELSPTLGSAAMSGMAFWFFAALAAALAILTAIRWAKKRELSPRIWLAALMLALSLTGRRNMALFAIVAAPMLMETARGLWPEERRAPRWIAATAAGLIAAFSVFPLSGAYYVRMMIPARFGLGMTPSFFPHGFPAHQRAAGFSGQIYNSNTLGGFLALNAAPGQVPLTDGRWEVYDAAELNRVRSSAANGALFETVARDYNVKGILLQHHSPEARAMLPWLARASAWHLTWHDAGASFWKSTGGINFPRTPPKPARFEDCVMLDSFYEAIGAGELQCLNLQNALRFPWKRSLTLEKLGMAELRLGYNTDAMNVFRQLLQRDPSNGTALNELAYLCAAAGDFAGAEVYLNRAIKDHPDDPDLRRNLDRVRSGREGRMEP